MHITGKERAAAWLDGFYKGLNQGRNEKKAEARKALSMLDSKTLKTMKEQIARGYECELKEQRR